MPGTAVPRCPRPPAPIPQPAAVSLQERTRGSNCLEEEVSNNVQEVNVGMGCKNGCFGEVLFASYGEQVPAWWWGWQLPHVPLRPRPPALPSPLHFPGPGTRFC